MPLHAALSVLDRQVPRGSAAHGRYSGRRGAPLEEKSAAAA
jgi:hypothetical protein